MKDKVLLISVLISVIIVLIALQIGNLSNYEVDKNSYLTINNAHIASLILARGGSKGIRHKNLALFSNMTLLGNSLKIIQDFGQFTSVWVSTDDGQIASEARKFNANVHFRDAATATDSASSIVAVDEFIKKHPEVDIVGLIQCTSPFLKNEHLEKAFKLLKQGYHSIFSVTREFKLRWKINGVGKILPDNFNPLFRPRRQDWTGDIVENGMFYFTYSDLIIKTGLLQSGKLAIVEVPLNESLEIDTPNDLIIANTLIKILENGTKS